MNTLIDCPVVILAGGKSSRMKTDKSLLPFGRYDTLIEYQYKKLQKIFKEVYISSKEDKFEFLEDKNKLILDNSSIYSPMIALKSILQTFSNSYVFIIAVDIPLLTKESIDKLYSKIKDQEYKLVLPKDKQGDRHNLCGFYHTSISDDIDNLLSENIHKIGLLIERVNSHIIQIDTIEEFLNLNELESYKKACDVLA